MADLTREERLAIAALKRVAKRWPKSLWLFSASGTLCVMKCGPDGEEVCLPGVGGGVDPEYMVDRIDIDNDGGDW